MLCIFRRVSKWYLQTTFYFQNLYLIRRAYNSCFAFCSPRSECPPKHQLSRLWHCGFSVYSPGKCQGRFVATTSSHISCNSLISHHGRSLQASHGVGTVQGLGYGRTFQISNPFMDQKFVSSPKRRGRLWDQPSLLLNGYIYTECFTTWGHYCRRWFPRSLWSKKFI